MQIAGLCSSEYFSLRATSYWHFYEPTQIGIGSMSETPSHHQMSQGLSHSALNKAIQDRPGISKWCVLGIQYWGVAWCFNDASIGNTSTSSKIRAKALVSTLPCIGTFAGLSDEGSLILFEFIWPDVCCPSWLHCCKRIIIVTFVQSETISRSTFGVACAQNHGTMYNSFARSFNQIHTNETLSWEQGSDTRTHPFKWLTSTCARIPRRVSFVIGFPVLAGNGGGPTMSLSQNPWGLQTQSTQEMHTSAYSTVDSVALHQPSKIP